MAATQDEVPAGNVAKLVNRLSKDLSKEIVFRKSANTTKVATVRFSYHAAQDDELSLKVDDVIEVIEDAEVGWMKGKLRTTGQIGLFPTNFVHFSDESPEALQRSSVTEAQKARSTPSFVVGSKKTDEENSENVTTKEKARVMYLYTPKHDDELALKEVGTLINVISRTCADPGWFLGEINGKRGLIPDNFVEFIKVATPESKKSPTVPVPSVPSVPAKPAKPLGLGVASAGSVTNKASNVIPPTSGKSSITALAPSGSGARSGSRVFDPAFTSTLAEALNKQPKTFGLKPAQKYEEGPADTRVEGPLEHITTSRPKQPNKRPPSTILNKRKSNDVTLDSTIPESSEPEATSFSKRNAATTSPAFLHSTAPFSTSSATPQLATSIISEKGDTEFVPYAEFKRLFDAFTEFRKDMLSKVASLEAKVASMK